MAGARVVRAVRREGRAAATEDRSAVARLKLNNLKQEVGEVSTADGNPLDFAALPVGALLAFAPHHSCATGHNHQTIKVLEGGRIVDEYDVCKGW